MCTQCRLVVYRTIKPMGKKKMEKYNRQNGTILMHEDKIMDRQYFKELLIKKNITATPEII